MNNDIHGEASPIKPVYAYNEKQAGMAYEVYAAMRRIEAAQPSLASNKLWILHRNEAFDLFIRSFEVVA